MDVSFTNVLEGARQYFQGLPTATGSTSSPSYQSTPENRHEPDKSSQTPPTSSGYWPMQRDSPRASTREPTPNQRPASHHSDSSRPPSHHSQLGYSPSHELPRSQAHNPFQPPYHDQSPQQQHQAFQFPRPQSREAPSNVSQQQTNQHYQSHIVQAPSYQPPSSPQQPRTPSRHNDQNVTPTSSQSHSSSSTPTSQSYHSTHSTSSPQSYPTPASTTQYYHQMQSQQTYQNYQQNRSFYPPQSHSQTKAQVSPSNIQKVPPTSQHYGQSAHDNTYYKNNYSYTPVTQSSAQVPNQYDMMPRAQSVKHPPQETKYSYTSSNCTNTMQTPTASKGHSTTHNLPPIASLSSVNYLASRSNRDLHRSNNSGRIRTLSSSSHTASSAANNPTFTNAEQLSHIRMNNSSLIHQSTVASSANYSPGVPASYANPVAYSNQARTESSQTRPYVTTIAQSYNHTVMTTSSIPSYNMSAQQQSSTSRIPYYQPSKTLITPQPVQTSRIQPSVITSQPSNVQPAEVSAHVDLTVGNSNSSHSALMMKHKRESPLDLSVKTVRTSADSTHEDTDHDIRQKNAANYNRNIQSISTNSYSTYDMNNSFQRNLTQRPVPVSTASAPKVDFLPDFSLSHSNIQRNEARVNTLSTASSEKPNTNHKLPHDRVNQHYRQYSPSSRYPTASVPSAAHVNSYIHSQSTIKRPPENAQRENLPRIDFPVNSYKAPTVYPTPSPQDINRKRIANSAPSAVPNKIVKVDSWKQTIDQQIEQRFSSYKQQQEQIMQNQNQSRPVVVNGYSERTNERTSKDLYGPYQRPDHAAGAHFNMYPNNNQYQSQSNLSQTYVPTVPGHHYPNFSNYTAQTQQQNMHNQHPTQLPRSLSNSSLHSAVNKNNTTKNAVGGAANKHVLSLLRNSLEIKGAKEAQRKLEQEQSQMINKAHEHINARPDVQQPSTDVTAPIQPKPELIVRQNVSPFTPTNLPETNYNTIPTPYKLHIPKAVDSVNFDTDSQNTTASTDKLTENHHISANNTSSSDLDGLAAFLAARIRTKAELKQVGPSHPYSASNNSQSTFMSTNESHLHSIIENQLKTPIKGEITSSENPTPNSTNSSLSVSPPKLTKEKQMYSPRRRLFSRNEDEQGCISKVPPRDNSGLRSSSETSIFDFPDSESDGEMPILERQSLEDMRRDRKTGTKSVNVEIKTEETSTPSSPIRPLSPVDDIFDQACNNFMEQLKTNIGKKRGRRKKGMDHEVLAMLEETVTKEKPLEEVKIKVEIDDTVAYDTEEAPIEICVDNIKTELPETPMELSETPQEDSDTPLADWKVEGKAQGTHLKDPNVKKANKKDKETSISPKMVSPSESETNKENEQRTKSSPKKTVVTEARDHAEEDISNSKSNEHNKKNEVPLVIRPAKKPTFGDGSDFYPGWEEEVCKYKKSLRMPPSLIQITRPPQSHRLSTSLPDLDRPHPYSPSDSHEFTTTKTKFTKIKSETLDSESESNSSFNLFSIKSNYDSEESSSAISLPNTVSKDKESSSILNKLFQRYGGHKKRKHKKKEDGPKIIPKSDSDLLPTPSLEIKTKTDGPKKAEPVIASESALLGFRTKTIETFKETFIKAKKIVGVNEHLTTVVLNSRTRKETKVLKQRATIKEVFGEDRPASAPPDTCVNEVKIKEEVQDVDDRPVVNSANSLRTDVKDDDENQSDATNNSCDPKQLLKNRILNKDRKRTDNLYKTLVDKKIKTELKEEPIDEIVDNDIIKRDPDTKSETPSLDGDESSNSSKKKSKFRNIRRKCSSGFDYIRKKKKQSKKDNPETDPALKTKRRVTVTKASPESVQDIQKEIKSWVLNKGIGETYLHRAARHGYTDVTVYCLEKMDCSPSQRDNAGYTPLHEACSRGHLDIAKLLLSYGANPSESAQGGIRPLHEAVENGSVEIVRLLLSYGADPMLATYAGLTPLALASDEATHQLLENHLADTRGEARKPWFMYGPASCFDSKDLGYNILDDVPDPDPVSEEEDIEFEVSDIALPNLYTLRGEPPNDRWMLLQDLSNLLKIKSRDALLRQICGTSQTSSSSTSVNYKSVLRELKMSDFLEQAHCCQFLNAGEKVNTRASKIALVKYTDKVKELLNVEKMIISLR